MRPLPATDKARMPPDINACIRRSTLPSSLIVRMARQPRSRLMGLPKGLPLGRTNVFSGLPQFATRPFSSSTEIISVVLAVTKISVNRLVAILMRVMEATTQSEETV